MSHVEPAAQSGPGPIGARRQVPIALLVAAAVLAIGALIWQLSAPHGYQIFGSNGIDTRVYRGGGLAVLHGLPVYDAPVYRYWQFTYPPFAAILMAPLGLITADHARLVMSMVNVLCLLVLVALSLRSLGYRRDRRFWVATVLLAVAVTALEPVRTTFWNGQINLVLAVLVVGGLTLPLGRWRGIGVGLAAGIKLTPLFFLGYLAVTRQWRAIAVALTTFAVTVLIGLAVLREQAWRFWTVAMRDTSRIGALDAPANQSFNGLFARFGSDGVWQAPVWLWLPVGAVAAVLGLYAAWRAYRAGAVLLAITITGMTSAAVAPFSWGHHWIWVVPLMAVVLSCAAERARRDRPLTWTWWLLVAGLVLATFSWMTASSDEHGTAVWRFGSYRLATAVVGDPAAGSWGATVAAAGSGTYLCVFLITLAVTLWWTGKVDPIRFRESARSQS